MAASRTETLRAPATLAGARTEASIALGRAALWAMFAAKLLGAGVSAGTSSGTCASGATPSGSRRT